MHRLFHNLCGKRPCEFGVLPPSGCRVAVRPLEQEKKSFFARVGGRARSCIRKSVSSFAFKPGKSIRRELKRIARKELGRAADRLNHEQRDDEDVHEGRKSLKKVEALSALLEQVGSAPRRKDLKRLRETRRALSRVRDRRAIIETFDRLRSRLADRLPEHTSALIRAHLARRKSATMRRARASAGTLARAGKAVRKLRRAAGQWSPPSIELSDLPKILKHSYRASKRAMKRARRRGRAEDFHGWRKRVKSLWLQLRLVERLAASLSARIEQFKELETSLGEEHNFFILRNELRHDRGLRQIRSHIDDLSAMSTAVEEELRRGALVLGAGLFTMSSKAFAKDIGRRLRRGGARPRKPSRRILCVLAHADHRRQNQQHADKVVVVDEGLPPYEKRCGQR